MPAEVLRQADVDPIVMGAMAERFPRITELAQAASHEGVLGRCDDDIEFSFGLDLILEAPRGAQSGQARVDAFS